MAWSGHCQVIAKMRHKRTALPTGAEWQASTRSSPPSWGRIVVVDLTIRNNEQPEGELTDELVDCSEF